MAEASTPVLPERVPWRRRRGAVPLLALAGAFVVLSSVVWYALSPGPLDPATVARDVRGTGAAGRPVPPEVAGPPPPPPLGAGETATVAPPRSVAAPVREEEGERWSKPRPGAAEPWLNVEVVDATSGAPLESAIVRAAVSAEALAAQDDGVTSARTGATGIAKLWDPPRGLGGDLPWLLATAERHAPSLLPVTGAVPTGTHAFCVRGRTIVLPLPAARPLAVHVVRRDARGSAVPVAGARVVARAPWAEEADWFAGARTDAQLRRLLTCVATTDAKGDAAFVPLARQPWRLHVAATGFDSEDLVLSAAQALEGDVQVELRELYVAAVALPSSGLANCPSLEWDGTPAWFAPDAIEWIPDHLTREERAAATANLARRPDVAEALEPEYELRCRFATLHSEELARGRPVAIPARVQTLPGEEDVDVTLTFVPFEGFNRHHVFIASAPPVGATCRVRLTWSDEPATPARFAGSLERNGASGDPIFVREIAFSPHELNLDLPPGQYHLDGVLGGHFLIVGFDVSEGDRVVVELLPDLPRAGYGYLSSRVDPDLVAVHDPLGRARLHFELTLLPSDRSNARRQSFSGSGSKILTFRSRYEPGDPFSILNMVIACSDLSWLLRTVEPQDLTLEAFGCIPTSFPRVRFRLDAPVELEAPLDEFATTSW
jgi:hypothetical protein